jgi:FkbM family methyltransferase
MSLTDRLFAIFIKNKWRGKDRLHSIFTKLGHRNLFTFTAKYGVMLNLSPNEYIDNIIVREGFYESEVTEEILSALEDGGTLWDIGANIGIHSIAAKKLLPDITVYSFEPNPKIINQLYENAMLNKAGIHICGFALFERPGPMVLHIAAGNSGMTTLVPSSGFYNSTMQCLTTTGDLLKAGGFKQPTVIKLDTEGSELSILKGCSSVLADPALKVILFEACNDLLENADEEIVLLLKQHGFGQIRRLDRAELSHHSLSNFSAARE